MVIVRPDLVTCPGKIVFVGLRQVFSDGLLVFSVDGQENGGGCGNGSLDAFGVVMGHLGAQSGHMQHPGKVILDQPGNGRDPHGGSVPEAPVGLWLIVIEPDAEFHAVACKGITPAYGLHGLCQCLPQLVVGSVPPRLHDGIRHGQGHDGIVRELRTVRDQLELLGLDVM